MKRSVSTAIRSLLLPFIPLLADFLDDRRYVGENLVWVLIGITLADPIDDRPDDGALQLKLGVKSHVDFWID